MSNLDRNVYWYGPGDPSDSFQIEFVFPSVITTTHDVLTRRTDDGGDLMSPHVDDDNNSTSRANKCTGANLAASNSKPTDADDAFLSRFHWVDGSK